jgi:hypothetical protein
MTRLILHVGTHKTGTTSVQGTLDRMREELRRSGVHYPDASAFLGGPRDAHHAFAHAMNGAERKAMRNAQRFIRHLRREAGRRDTVVISAEAMYRHVHHDFKGTDDYWGGRRAYLAGIAKALSGFQVEVVLFLRRQDRFTESLYSETVTKRMIQQPFYRWRHSLRRLCDYSAQVDVLSSVFPAITVHRYEDATEGVEKVFFDHLGLGAPDDVIYDRRSPDARLLLWMRLTQAGTWPLRREFAASTEAMALFDDYGRATLWASLEERRDYLRQFAGPYGHEFFDTPTSNGTAAQLDDAMAGRIEEAWKGWTRQRQEPAT